MVMYKTLDQLQMQYNQRQTEARPPLQTNSSLRVDLAPETVDFLLEAHKAKFFDTCLEQFGGDQFTWRDILPTDLKGYTVEEFLEAGGTDNTWTAMAMGGGNAISDDTCIMIWSLQLFAEEATTTGRFPTTAAFQFKVGSTIRARFSAYPLWAGNFVTTGTSAGSPFPGSKIAYLMSPIILSKNQTFTAEEYVITSTCVYRLFVYGLTAEKVGKTVQG